MFQEEKILKVKQSFFGVSMVEPTRDGRFYILTNKRKLLTRDLTRNSDSMSIDHSTLCPDFH